MRDSSSERSAEASTPERLAYRVREAAELLGLSERKVWQLVERQEIESFTIGTARRISRDALLAYVEKLRSAA